MFSLWLSGLRNQCSLHEDVGSLPGLAQQVKDLVLPQAVACGIDRSCVLELELPWHRLAAAAPIWPLAWELPYAAGTAL